MTEKRARFEAYKWIAKMLTNSLDGSMGPEVFAEYLKIQNAFEMAILAMNKSPETLDIE